MKITAQDLLKFGVIDKIVPEPPGGAHRDPRAMMDTLGEAIAQALGELKTLSPVEVREHRYAKFLAIGRAL